MPWNPHLLARSNMTKLTRIQMRGCRWYLVVLMSRACVATWKQRINHFSFANLVPSLLMLTFTGRKNEEIWNEAEWVPGGWWVQKNYTPSRKPRTCGVHAALLLTPALFVGGFCFCCCSWQFRASGLFKLHRFILQVKRVHLWTYKTHLFWNCHLPSRIILFFSILIEV